MRVKGKYQVTTIESITKSNGFYPNNIIHKNSFTGSSSSPKYVTIRLVLAVIIVNVFAIGYGIVHRYMAPDHKSRRPFQMNFIVISWRESLIPLGIAFGCLISGNVVDFLGRKLTILTMSLLCIVGLTIEAAQTNADVMYVGLLFAGFAAFMTFSAVMIYMSETAPSVHRGHLMSLCSLSVTLGELTVTLVGTALPWNWLAIFAAGFFALPPTFLVFLPESPRWFLMKRKTEAAHESLSLFRGDNVDCNKEIEVIVNAMPRVHGYCSAWKELAKPSNLKELAMCSVLIVVQQFAGNSVLSVYRVHLRGASGLRMNPFIINTITGLSSTFGGIACLLLIERVGRRALIILSMTCMTVSMALYGVYYQVISDNPSATVTWFPLSCVAVHNFSFRMGLWQIPNILICELLPTEARGVGQAVINSFANLVSFVQLKTFFYIVQDIHYTGCFLLYSAISIFGTVFAFFYVSDTSNRIIK